VRIWPAAWFLLNRASPLAPLSTPRRSGQDRELEPAFAAPEIYQSADLTAT
jgi:hypothetical protein